MGSSLSDRGDYYQIAYIIPKGADAGLRARDIGALHAVLVNMVPRLADRIGTLSSFDDVKLLDVQLNRLRRWYADGVLCIGDATHAMSPVGGSASTSRWPTRWPRRASWRARCAPDE